MSPTRYEIVAALNEMEKAAAHVARLLEDADDEERQQVASAWSQFRRGTRPRRWDEIWFEWLSDCAFRWPPDL